MRRLLSLLFLCAFAPAVLAQTADLRVSLTMPPNAFYNGSYALAAGNLTITNAGNVPAEDVTFDFSGLGASLPYKNVTCSWGQTTHCKVPSIVPGSVTVPIFGEWFDLVAGTVETMSVTVSSATTPDPDYTNNTATANTTIVWKADLAFVSFDVPSTVASGNSAVIGASFVNHGPSPATDFALTISIPPGAKYVGYLSDSFGCTEPPVGGHGDLVCTSPSYDYRFTPDFIQALVSVDPSLAPGTVLPVTATLTSTTPPQSPQTASGTLTVAAPTTPDAAVSVTATLDKPSVVAGYQAWETYTVSNTGPRDAEIVTLDIRPPGGYAYWVAHPSLGSCDGNGPIHCTMATLPAGATMTLQVLVQTYYGYPGTLTSTAVVTWLHGGTIATSNSLVITNKPARRRATRH